MTFPYLADKIEQQKEKRGKGSKRRFFRAKARSILREDHSKRLAGLAQLFSSKDEQSKGML